MVCIALCALTRANLVVANVINLLLTPVDILLIPSFVCEPTPTAPGIPCAALTPSGPIPALRAPFFLERTRRHSQSRKWSRWVPRGPSQRPTVYEPISSRHRANAAWLRSQGLGSDFSGTVIAFADAILSGALAWLLFMATAGPVLAVLLTPAARAILERFKPH